MLDVVIPSAGKGTRMQSITGGEPKELLPINGIPLIVHTLQGAVEAGATRIFIIVSPQKPELRVYLINHAQLVVQDHMVDFTNLDDFGIECIFLEQAEPLGVAHALSLTEPHIGTSDFLALMPDNYYPNKPSPTAQIVRHYNPGRCCTGIMKLSPEFLPFFSNTGLVTFEKVDTVMVKITTISDKKAGNFTSDINTSVFRTIGCTMYSHDFFHVYHTMEHPDISEMDDIPILQRISNEGKMDGCIIKDIGFDAGNPAGYSAALNYSR